MDDDKVCPFCGSKPKVRRDNVFGVKTLHCPNFDECHISGILYVSGSWNTRYDDGEHAEMMNKLKLSLNYMLFEAQNNPLDSLADIANDAFADFNVPLVCDNDFNVSDYDHGK